MAQYSRLFNPPDADVIFQSSDGVLFGIHRINLQTNTEGFPPPEIQFASTGEVVSLSESSSTLDRLFQFIYPRRHPGLDDIEFDELDALAEAAEKYQVFSAMNICQIRMRSMLPNHAPKILAYAAKHDYPYLVYEAAPYTFDVPLSEVVSMLPQYLILPWVKYIDAWNAVLHEAISDMQRAHINKAQYGDCRTWRAERAVIAQNFGHSLRSLRQLDTIFNTDGIKLPPCCEAAKAEWRKAIDDAIALIPPFSRYS
ncbi:hypothetical protein R3P38DRAFT_616274 [Favolaschia claudopus]|uniref:BTB domain-containing protein n=1 Tax=Favolaschia claudopus TaxID=2862362 RepID=A0AAW0C9T5_9AGAR